MQDIYYFINQNVMLCAAWLGVLVLLILVDLKERLYGPKGLATTELTNLINQHDALVIDLRSSSDYSKGHITKAESFGASELRDSATLLKSVESKLKSKTDKPVVLVCKDGISSKQQAFKLKSKGLAKVSYLNGGMNMWKSEGLPTVTS